jgi:hypothetical protein
MTQPEPTLPDPGISERRSKPRPPDETPQPQPVAVDPLPANLNINAEVVPSPLGPLVVLTLQYGYSAHRIAFDPGTAEQLGPVLAEVLTNAAAQARRAASGLMVATPDQLKGLLLPPPNGRRGH